VDSHHVKAKDGPNTGSVLFPDETVGFESTVTRWFAHLCSPRSVVSCVRLLSHNAQSITEVPNAGNRSLEVFVIGFGAGVGSETKIVEVVMPTRAMPRTGSRIVVSTALARAAR
jgi:hypothetical protein